MKSTTTLMTTPITTQATTQAATLATSGLGAPVYGHAVDATGRRSAMSGACVRGIVVRPGVIAFGNTKNLPGTPVWRPPLS